jgi:hypothetical protein
MSVIDWVRRQDALFWSRLVSGFVAVGCLTVLGLSVWLEPSAAGHSTHLQLGLAPCTFFSWTGLPCPMCGATTTFALLAHLRVLEGVLNQPFAALLFGMTVWALVVATLEVMRPRNRWGLVYERIAPWEGLLAIGFLGAMVIGWIYKISYMYIDGALF